MKKIYIKQLDESDCAAACLASISLFYGRETTISKLRDLLGTGIKGTNLKSLINGAKELGFDAKAIKITYSNLVNKKCKPPFIAYILNDQELPHFIVVYNINSKYFLINDPAKKEKKISHKDFEQKYSGIIILMKPSYLFKPEKIRTKSIVSQFMLLISSNKKYFILAIIASITLTVLGVTSNFFSKILIDDILPNESKTDLTKFSLIFLLIALINVSLSAIRSHIILHLSIKIDIPLTMGYYKHVFSLPLNFFSSRKTGEILTRFSDAHIIKDVFTGIALSILIDVSMVILVGVVLALMNIKLFFIIIFATLVNILLIYIFKKPYKNINMKQMEQGSKLNSSIIESLEAIETIKSNSFEEKSLENIENNYIDTIKTNYYENILYNVQQTISSIISAIINIIILWIGATSIIKNQLTLGALMAFSSMATMFMNPIGRLISLQMQIQETKISMKRLSEIFDIDKEDKEDKEDNFVFDHIGGNIEVKDVTFGYDKYNPILKDINLIIEKKQKIAFVGESGSGKTTLAKLIVGLIKPDNGNILLDGINIKSVNSKSLRKNISYINQNSKLLSGTIIENLKMSNFEATTKEIYNAIKISNCDFIDNLPNGLNTYLEHGGNNLSGGEKQKVSIARALVKRSNLIILDEATSNLDFISEQKIYNNIFKNFLNTTVIFIAHRLYLTKNCDLIYVFKKGNIVEKGNYRSLIKKRGEYWNMWKSQEFFSNEKKENNDINKSESEEMSYE